MVLKVGDVATVVDDGTEERFWMAGKTGRIDQIKGNNYWMTFLSGATGCYPRCALLRGETTW